MSDLPHELSPAQHEAKQILAKLLSRLRETDSKYYPRYGKWIERHSRLEEFCLQCIRPQVWSFLQGRWSLDALKTIAGDLRFEGRGVYLNGVLGLDRRVRVYVGQAACIRQRVAQHLNFRYRRDNPSLHYHAMQRSTYNAIGLLATLPSPGLGSQILPGMDQPELLLNVLEMWMCLTFRSLPTQTLDTWLTGLEGVSKERKEGKEGQFGGLNIASPLDQGDKAREWVDLGDSDDPLVLDYLGLEWKTNELEQRKKKYTEAAKALAKREQDVILVPQWLVLGGLALALGFIVFSSSRPRLKFKGRLG